MAALRLCEEATPATSSGWCVHSSFDVTCDSSSSSVEEVRRFRFFLSFFYSWCSSMVGYVQERLPPV